MTIDNELIDNLLKDYKKPEDIIGENGLLKQLTKQLLERAMAAELTDHVGYEKHHTAGHKRPPVRGPISFGMTLGTQIPPRCSFKLFRLSGGIYERGWRCGLHYIVKRIAAMSTT